MTLDDHQRRAPGHGKPAPFERALRTGAVVVPLNYDREIDRMMAGPVADYEPSDLRRVGDGK